ncbi:MAG TPA: hypothetical protein VFE96_08460, partial [Candidatus Bathyarchaeia archaeon]|nr:hypothetical protein [Candidatus Bathyarchaeia archaeon]
MMLGLVAAVWSSSLAQSNPRSSQSAAPLSPLCKKGDPLAGVYYPLRFRILNTCQVGSGPVGSVTRHDRDEWANVTQDGSIGQVRYLVLELEPQYGATVPVPFVGEHITFVGPLVFDLENQMNAIYPVWSITAS